MSTYERMTPAASDDYDIYPAAVAVAPQEATAGELPKKVHSRDRSEFYKPFHYVLLVYLFFYCSRIPELIPYLHVGLVLQPILLVGMILTGTAKNMFRSDIGRYMTAFTIWVAIGVPFSTWRGGSFQILLLSLQALVLMFCMAAFVRTLEDCYRVITVMAVAAAAVGVLSLLVGGSLRPGDPRLGLGQKAATLADANIFALYLAVGLPCIWFASTIRSGLLKIPVLCLVIPVLLALGHTGSRMGLLALVIEVLFFLVFASATQRITILLGGVLCLALAGSFLPQRILERFTTFFQAQSAASEEAAASSEARMIMLKRGLELSLEHPLLGVGPGEFIDAEAKEAAAAHQRAQWRYTHNCFLEVSSETGVLGLILFVVPFYRAYKGVTPFRSRFPSKRVRQAALCIQLAMLATLVGTFFLSIAYSGILYAVLGLSMAFQLAAARRYREVKAEA